MHGQSLLSMASVESLTRYNRCLSMPLTPQGLLCLFMFSILAIRSPITHPSNLALPPALRDNPYHHQAHTHQSIYPYLFHHFTPSYPLKPFLRLSLPYLLSTSVILGETENKNGDVRMYKER